MRRTAVFMLIICLAVSFAGCPAAHTGNCPSEKPAATEPSDTEARAFMKAAEDELLRLWIAAERAEWVRMTYLIEDTAIIAARAQEELMGFVGKKATEATRFDKLELPYDLRRKIDRLKTFLSMPAPKDSAGRAELAKIATRMDALYAKGKYCSERQGGKCLNLGELSEILAKSRDYDELLDAWVGWRTISPPIRPLYRRFAELANQGARDMGYADLGRLWNSRYDMDPADFEAETERLWQQVKPLYHELHCHVRARLAEKYGQDRVPPGKPIPAHLLGNMWSQEWSNVFDLLAPDKAGALDMEKILAERKVDQVGMVRRAEGFFTSLGLMKLPGTFYERSMFTRPRDREVVCHASAWDIDQMQDVRIKMCIKINGEDFTTIHHELGHIYYFLAYRDLDPLYRNSANDGFHEAMGDLMALSVTPAYLKNTGLIDEEPPENLNPLMARALDKVAFLPWGLLVDRWRWGVFSGRIKPEDYNKSWWELRTKYQGVAPAVSRTEENFDPGAKYHIPGNTPYTRYFLASILQFQFHRALCSAAGHQGPLHTCSIHGNAEIGARIDKMMRMGASRPWPEALRVLTGEEKMDAGAMIEYFQPLHDWLKEQNKGRKCGW